MTFGSDIAQLREAADQARFGAKAARLARLIGAGLPAPQGFALSFESVARLAADGNSAFDGPFGAAIELGIADLERRRGEVLGGADAPLLVALRASAGPNVSGAHATLNIGATEAALGGLSGRIGAAAARLLRLRMIHDVAIAALGVDVEALEAAAQAHSRDPDAAIAASLAIIATETGAPFPEDPRTQLRLLLLSASRAWARPRARMMREARGEDPDAGLGFIIEAMALGVGEGLCGSGYVETRSRGAGLRGVRGKWLPQAQGEEAALGLGPAAGLETLPQETFELLADLAERAETALGDALRLELTLENGAALLLDAEPMSRSARAALNIAVDLAERGVISRRDALLRVDPAMLVDHLHPSIDPKAMRDVIGRGLPASPGAAAGPIAFTALEAEAAAARGEKSVLVRLETKPEDIRGIHAAAAVLTLRGGMTSHAAVVARGLGVPCVVGASAMSIDAERGLLRAEDGRVFERGDLLTLDGGAGLALKGRAEMIAADLSGPFATLMGWADAERRLTVRANADTPADARMARDFGADGIGLCRTEHMFFERGRVTAMREMILAETPEIRRAALKRLLPWQRADFVELFTIMQGLPVAIRLLDPPLHEFLPQGADELADLAAATGLSVERIRARAAEMGEFNPMLGLRGCRLGVTAPEIYEMQARAIFEAAIETATATGAPVEPEVVIPLVSTRREMTHLRTRIEEVAAEVASERGADFAWKIGCMVETPRAALRAGDIARSAEFLSFGTNDLTQLVYGLSRDDSGRFMGAYLSRGMMASDPFQTLDLEGVGELMLTAAERARGVAPGISLGLCGEHGGDPVTVRFCELARFAYVSCSPYRVPIARLSAAQAHLLSAGSSG